MYRFLITLKLSVLAFLALTFASAAQISDPRVLQLEEQVRNLTGQVEELNFQILQMQENLRKQQEDLEYRLQELEDQKQGSVVTDQAPETDVADISPDKPAQNVAGVATVGAATAGTAARLGQPPRDLGAIKVDQAGNILETSVDFSAQSVEKSIDGTQVASVGGSVNAEELYSAGYKYVLNGDYALAEEVFSTFVDTYPDDPLVADARFWLGESLLGQGRFEEAADAFIMVRSLHPTANKAPETLYKIGSIMAALGNREIACVTFEDALKTHVNMSPPLRNKIGDERAKAKC